MAQISGQYQRMENDAIRSGRYAVIARIHRIYRGNLQAYFNCDENIDGFRPRDYYRQVSKSIYAKQA